MVKRGGLSPPKRRARKHIYDVSIPIKAASSRGGNGSGRKGSRRGDDIIPRPRGAEDTGGFNESNNGVISWVSEGSGGGGGLQQLRDVYGSRDETLESTAGLLVLLFYKS